MRKRPTERQTGWLVLDHRHHDTEPPQIVWATIKTVYGDPASDAPTSVTLYLDRDAAATTGYNWATRKPRNSWGNVSETQSGAWSAYIARIGDDMLSKRTLARAHADRANACEVHKATAISTPASPGAAGEG